MCVRSDVTSYYFSRLFSKFHTFEKIYGLLSFTRHMFWGLKFFRRVGNTAFYNQLTAQQTHFQ